MQSLKNRLSTLIYPGGQTRIFSLLALVAIVLVLPLAVIVLQYETNYKQGAASNTCSPACPGGSYCQGGGPNNPATCQPQKGAGASCNPGAGECINGLNCIAHVNDPYSGTCEAGTGTQCGPGVGCQAGDYCQGGGPNNPATCQPQKGAGASCNVSSHECISGLTCIGSASSPNVGTCQGGTPGGTACTPGTGTAQCPVLGGVQLTCDSSGACVVPTGGTACTPGTGTAQCPVLGGVQLTCDSSGACVVPTSPWRPASCNGGVLSGCDAGNGTCTDGGGSWYSNYTTAEGQDCQTKCANRATACTTPPQGPPACTGNWEAGNICYGINSSFNSCQTGETSCSLGAGQVECCKPKPQGIPACTNSSCRSIDPGGTCAYGYSLCDNGIRVGCCSISGNTCPSGTACTQSNGTAGVCQSDNRTCGPASNPNTCPSGTACTQSNGTAGVCQSDNRTCGPASPQGTCPGYCDLNAGYACSSNQYHPNGGTINNNYTCPGYGFACCIPNSSTTGNTTGNTTGRTIDTCTPQGSNYTCVDSGGSCPRNYSQAAGICTNGKCCKQNAPQATSTPVPTRTPRATNTPRTATNTPTPTSGTTTGNGGATKLAFSLLLQGIRNDSPNNTDEWHGRADANATNFAFNTTPQNTQRDITLYVYKENNIPQNDPTLQNADFKHTYTNGLVFNNATGTFDANINLADAFNGTVVSGNYTFVVKTDNYLSYSLSNHQVTAGQAITIPNQQELYGGDANNDNVIDVLDYNAFIACYATPTSAACVPSTDINDNGNPLGANDVQVDLQLLIYTFFHRDPNNP